MGARELLAELTGAGFSITADGDRLMIRPASKLTDPVRAALRESKAELIRLLGGARGAHSGGDLSRFGDEARRGRFTAEHGRLSECPPWPASAVNWDDAEIDAFLARRDRLVRWGWPEPVADAYAERLVRRDRDGDDRRMCVECSALDPLGRCLVAAAGRLRGASRRLEPVPAVLQRCEGFMLAEGLR